MSSEIRNLEPKAVWNNFADLNAVPRPSKKEGRVINFMKQFGEKLGLETIEDAKGNVVIKKPASKGMDDRQTVVLQGHLDMVHQKNNDTDFDFDKEGIKMYVDGDWVRADGTTLGADNGLGVAAIMTVLESNTIAHPPLEALFTIDEEQGMTGAKDLDNTILNGGILLNLDTEEDDEIDIGCAGGVDVTATKSFTPETTPRSSQSFRISVKGLNGGHSGMDIIKGLGNANKLMNRILSACFKTGGMHLANIQGGGLRNAIPRESTALVTVDKNRIDDFKTACQSISEAIKTEYAALEKNIDISCEKIDAVDQVMSLDTTKQVLQSLSAAHNGVYRMSPDVDGLVETSNNIARVEVKDKTIEVQCLTRSSVESGKDELADSLTATFELAGFKVEKTGDYPGWQPNPDSAILKVVDKIYQQQVGKKAHVMACHAGLECGILLSHYPDMDTVSFGPTIRGAHSPDERAGITSTQKFWKLLQGVLENIPKKD